MEMSKKYSKLIIFLFHFTLLMSFIVVSSINIVWPWVLLHLLLFYESLAFKNIIFKTLLKDQQGKENNFPMRYLTFNIHYQIFFTFFSIILTFYIHYKCLITPTSSIYCILLFGSFKFSLIMNYVMEIHKMIFYYKIIKLDIKLPFLVRTVSTIMRYIKDIDN